MTSTSDGKSYMKAATALRWYGERGIVNALVVHVSASQVDRVPALLGAVRWADNSRPEWLESIRSTTLLVEWGLADFGNPDLIIVLETDDGPRCVFVEVKVGPYLSSMMLNRLGMRGPGFNSSINGQLALKFRFACALQCASSNATEIAEPPDLLQQSAFRLRIRANHLAAWSRRPSLTCSGS